MPPISISPDLLAAVLAGKDPNAPDPNAPKPAAPVVDPKYGKPSLTAQPEAQPPAAASTPVADPDAGNTQAAITPPVIKPTQDQTYTGSGYQPTFIRQASTALPPPTFNTDARTQAMKTLGTPAPTRDQYKPSALRTILGALATGAMAYGHVPNAVEIGQDAINAPYNRAMSSWQTQQGQAKELLGEENRDYEAETKNYQNALSNTMRGEQLDEKYANLERLTNRDNRIADLTQQLRDTQQQNADNRDPAAKIKAQMDQRTQEANAIGLKGRDRIMYLANGKLPEGMTEYQQRRLDQIDQQISDREARDANKPAGKSSSTFKDAAAVDKYSNSWYTKNQNDYNRQRNAILKNSDLSSEEKQAQIKTLDDLNNQQKSEFEDRKKGYYAALSGGKPVSVDENGEITSGNEAPQSGKRTPAQLSTKNLPTVESQKYTHTATNPKTGQQIGTKDGKTWYDVKTGKAIQ